MTEETTISVNYSVDNGSNDFNFKLVVFDPNDNPLGHVHATMDCNDDPCRSWSLAETDDHNWLTAADIFNAETWSDGKHAQNNSTNDNSLMIKENTTGPIKNAGGSACGAYTMITTEDISPFSLDQSTGKITYAGSWPKTGPTSQIKSFNVEVSLANTPTKRTKAVSFTLEGSCESTDWTNL